LAAVKTLPQPPLHHVAHSFDHRSMRAIAGDRPGERSTEAGVIGLGRMGSAIARRLIATHTTGKRSDADQDGCTRNTQTAQRGSSNVRSRQSD
jgi:hypothetical protein